VFHQVQIIHTKIVVQANLTSKRKNNIRKPNKFLKIWKLFRI